MDMGTISIAVIIVALLVAFNRASRKGVQRIWKTVGKPITKVFLRLPRMRVRSSGVERDAEKGVLGVERDGNLRRSESKARRSLVDAKARRSVSISWRDDLILGKYDVSTSTAS